MNSIDLEIGLQSPNWGEDSPRGGKAVLNRIIKEKATVPLFFGQTLVQSLRDLGYDTTTSALCEHVDNSIQWGAQEVRIYFSQTGKRGSHKIDILVLDNGKGMAPNVLKVATSFGGSMVYGNREGIGKYGMGMKTAALSMSPVMDLYSWQEEGAYYNMTLDVDEIGRERSNLIELPDPTLMADLPTRILDIITKPMIFPDSNEQDLFIDDLKDIRRTLGKSGTIVFMPECDRLTSATSRTLTEHTIREMSRVYRRFIAKGIKLYVNNRLVAPFDPTYSMLSARHTKIPGLLTKTSQLIISKTISVPKTEYSKDTAPITVRLYALPIEDWGMLPYKIRKNDLHIYDNHTVSILRNDRELSIGSIPQIASSHGSNNWLRVQIDFTGELDEAFGVAANKQGTRLQKYVRTLIAGELKNEIVSLRKRIQKYQSEQVLGKQGSGPSIGESRAGEAERLQSKPIDTPYPTTPLEEQQLETNLRTLATVLKRNMESDEEAFQRIKNSKYVIHFKYDSYWPFYHVEQQFQKIILTINTAHPFYSNLYEPLAKSAEEAARLASDQNTNIEEEEIGIKIDNADSALESLQLLLLSLARAQTILSNQEPEQERLFERLQKEWSDSYYTQLMMNR